MLEEYSIQSMDKIMQELEEELLEEYCIEQYEYGTFLFLIPLTSLLILFRYTQSDTRGFGQYQDDELTIR